MFEYYSLDSILDSKSLNTNFDIKSGILNGFLSILLSIPSLAHHWCGLGPGSRFFQVGWLVPTCETFICRIALYVFWNVPSTDGDPLTKMHLCEYPWILCSSIRSLFALFTKYSRISATQDQNNLQETVHVFCNFVSNNISSVAKSYKAQYGLVYFFLLADLCPSLVIVLWILWIISLPSLFKLGGIRRHCWVRSKCNVKFWGRGLT